MELGDVLNAGLPDVPRTVRTGGRLWPLDRFCVNRLRRALGRPEKAPEQEIERNDWQALYDMLESQAFHEPTVEEQEEKTAKAKVKEQQLINRQLHFAPRKSL